jgi:hypothetical protein
MTPMQEVRVQAFSFWLLVRCFKVSPKSLPRLYAKRIISVGGNSLASLWDAIGYLLKICTKLRQYCSFNRPAFFDRFELGD